MPRAPRNVLIVGLTVETLMILFPPWAAGRGNTLLRYAPVFNPPEVMVPLDALANEASLRTWDVHIAWPILLTQLLAVAVCSLAALLIVKRD